MAKDYYYLLYAALLHDIGKLLAYTRDGALVASLVKNLDVQETNTPSDLLDIHHGYLSAAFIRMHDERFKSLGFDSEKLARIAQHHHFHKNKKNGAIKPRKHPAGLQDSKETEIAYLVAWADSLASGMGRDQLDDETGSQVLPALRTVFAAMNIGEGDPPGDEALGSVYYTAGKLSAESILPSTLPTYLQADLDALVSGFVEAFAATLSAVDDDDNSRHACLTRLTTLLERFTCCLPYDKQQRNRDTSLYDHCRETLALAACFYEYKQSNPDLDITDLDQIKAEETFLLVAASLDGIQSHIFQVTADEVSLPERRVFKGSVKRLRARSFYLAALMRAVALRVMISCSSERLPLSCQFYNSAGKFYLVLPNTKQVRAWLFEVGGFVERVEHWLFDAHQGDLALLTVKRVMAIDDLLDGKKSPARFSLLRTDLTHAKKRKHASLIDAGVTRWKAGDYTHGLCPTCRLMPARKAAAELTDIERRWEGDEPRCQQCDLDRRFSEKLVRYDKVLYLEEPSNSAADEMPAYRVMAGEDTVFIQPYDDSKIGGGKRIVLDVHGFDHNWSSSKAAGLPVRFQPYCSYVPLFDRREDVNPEYCVGCSDYVKVEKAGHTDNACEFYQASRETYFSWPALKTFTCMAHEGRESGAQLIGVLKADVDNLGLLLGKGLIAEEHTKGEGASISRLATASRMLDLFFSGWVHKELEANYGLCYTVFSGGDDLLIVGPWQQIVDFSFALRERFNVYTGSNPNIHLSAAFRVVKPHYPAGLSGEGATSDLDYKAKEPWRYHYLDETTGESEERRYSGKDALWGLERLVPLSLREGQPSIIGPVSGIPLYMRADATSSDSMPVDWAHTFFKAASTSDLELGTRFLYKLLSLSDTAQDYLEDGEPRALSCLSRLAYEVARNRATVDKYKKKHGETTTWRVATSLLAKLQRLTEANGDSLTELALLRFPLSWALYAYRNERRDRGVRE